MVKADPLLQNLSEEQTRILLDGTQAWRDERKVGARPSNKSVAQDYRHAVKSINIDVICLFFFISSVFSFYLRLRPLRLVQERRLLHSSHAPT